MLRSISRAGRDREREREKDRERKRDTHTHTHTHRETERISSSLRSSQLAQRRPSGASLLRIDSPPPARLPPAGENRLVRAIPLSFSSRWKLSSFFFRLHKHRDSSLPLPFAIPILPESGTSRRNDVCSPRPRLSFATSERRTGEARDWTRDSFCSRRPTRVDELARSRRMNLSSSSWRELARRGDEHAELPSS